MNSPIKWVGGKKHIKKKLVSIMPNHTNYIEVFSGALWVLLEKEPSKLEVFNDINGDLINFYMVIKDENSCNELINRIYYTPSSRELFNIFDEDFKVNKIIDDIERAMRFYYILKLCFSGNIHREKRSFVIDMDGRKKINRDRFPQEFIQLHERIKHCYIERNDYKYILNKYDHKDSLFFCDPPYLDSTEDLYSGDFNEDEYRVLKDKLMNLKGKFILTVKNSEFVNDLFSDFYVYDNDVKWGIRPDMGMEDVKELIITNYEIEQ